MTFDEQAATLDRKSIVGLLTSHQQLTERNAELKRELDWLKNQLFGTKSERRFVDPDVKPGFPPGFCFSECKSFLVAVAKQAQQEKKHIDEIKVKSQCPHNGTFFGHGSILVLVIHVLDFLGVVGGQASKDQNPYNRDDKMHHR